MSPAVIDRAVSADESAIQRVTIGNSTAVRRSIDIRFQDVQDRGRSDGTYDAMAPGSSQYGAGSWLSVDRGNLVLSPGERRVVVVRIRVPRDAPAGSALAALVVHVRPEGGASFAVATEITQLVLLSVRGSASRTSLRMSLEPTSRFRAHSPLSWELRLRNTGNTHLVLRGETRLRGWGLNQSQALRSLILFPGSDRRIPISAPMSDRPLRATLSARMIDARSPSRAWHTHASPVWSVPWWVMVAVSVLIAALIARIWSIRRSNTVQWYPEDGSDGLSDE